MFKQVRVGVVGTRSLMEIACSLMPSWKSGRYSPAFAMGSESKK